MSKFTACAAALLLSAAPFACAADAPLEKLAPETRESCPKVGMGPGNAMSGETMAKMQAQMAQIRQTSDPAERRKLMQEAMQALRGNTGTAGSPCPQDCPQPMAGDCQKRDSCPRPAAQGMTNQPAMQQRMDMMQSMMENMLEHQRQMQENK